MKKLVWMLLFFPLFAIADTKDIVMDWLRINAQYEVKPTEWYKKNDTWMVDFTTKKNEQMKVAVTGTLTRLELMPREGFTEPADPEKKVKNADVRWKP